MCGLVGIMSSNLLLKHKNCLSALLYLDTWRGPDSTGVAAIRHNADTSTLKSTVPGYEFVEGPKLFEHLHLNDFCWIGHNRFGTVGKKTKSNAHPFEILDDDGSCLLVGAHNGTLKNKHDLKNHTSFGTDSEALFNQIAESNLEDTIATVEGAWALTYYDHILEEMRFLRNEERPLFYAFDKNKTTMFWASEVWMLQVATSRFDIELHQENGVAIRSFAIDTLYSVEAPMKTNDELVLRKRGAITGKKPFFQADWKKGWHGGTATHSTTAKTTQKTAPQTSNLKPTTTPQKNGEKQTLTSRMLLGLQSEKTDKVVPINSSKTFKGFKRVLLSFKELKEQLDRGCAWCELEEIPYNGQYAWLSDGKAVCHKCLTGSHNDMTLKTVKINSIH